MSDLKTTRRNFIKGWVIGGIIVYSSKSWAAEKVDIGECKSLKIRCISEASRVGQVQGKNDHGGRPFSITEDYPKKSTGFSALVEMEALDGTYRKFLLDTGWNPEWMESSFKREGVDLLLKKGEIEFLYISHEHKDHLRGLPAALRYCPNLKIFIPDRFSSEGRTLIKKSGHQGDLVEFGKGKIHKLFSGGASVTFDIPLLIQQEQALFFNIKDKGLVAITGCCHMGVLTLLEYGKENIQPAKIYGLYGGLHLAPSEKWNPKLDGVILGLKAMKLQKVALNHCTGIITIEKMIAANIPVIQGTGRYGSKSKLYLGHGDEAVF